MFPPRFTRTIAVTAIAILSILFTGTSASAARDTTPPTTPFLGYAEGFYCLTLIVGVQRSTDNVTPQSELRYEIFADGVFVGSPVDQGQPSGPWGVLVMKKAGTNMVTAQAIDAAGNRSALSRAVAVHGYFTPGCTPYHF